MNCMVDEITEPGMVSLGSSTLPLLVQQLENCICELENRTGQEEQCLRARLLETKLKLNLTTEIKDDELER